MLAQSFGQLSRRFVTSLGTRLTLAEQGAVAGTFVQPMGGEVIGAAIGVAIGAAVDYLGNAANEAFNRDGFVAANNQALDITIAAWKSNLEASMDSAVDKWFDDARSSVVLAGK
jgi:predicted lipid-binding transport protein (Tim44 family)